MVVRGRDEPPTFRFSEGLSEITLACTPGPDSPFHLHKGEQWLALPSAATLASVPDCARKCRIVRGFSVGGRRPGPVLVGILWGHGSQEAMALGGTRADDHGLRPKPLRRVPADEANPLPCDPVMA